MTANAAESVAQEAVSEDPQGLFFLSFLCPVF
jgi:hypothetical protein